MKFITIFIFILFPSFYQSAVIITYPGLSNFFQTVNRISVNFSESFPMKAIEELCSTISNTKVFAIQEYNYPYQLIPSNISIITTTTGKKSFEIDENNKLELFFISCVSQTQFNETIIIYLTPGYSETSYFMFRSSVSNEPHLVAVFETMNLLQRIENSNILQEFEHLISTVSQSNVLGDLNSLHYYQLYKMIAEVCSEVCSEVDSIFMNNINHITLQIQNKEPWTMEKIKLFSREQRQNVSLTIPGLKFLALPFKSNRTIPFIIISNIHYNNKEIFVAFNENSKTTRYELLSKMYFNISSFYV